MKEKLKNLNWKIVTALVIMGVSATLLVINILSSNKEETPEPQVSNAPVEITATPTPTTAATIDIEIEPTQETTENPAPTEPTAEASETSTPVDTSALPKEFPLPEGLTVASVTTEGNYTRVRFAPENMEEVVKFYNLTFREDTSSSPYYVSGYQGAPDNSGARFQLIGPGLKEGSKLVMRGDEMYLDIQN